MQRDERDIVVIGAGLAGLMAALTAARAGARVALLDGRRSLGGRARTHVHSDFHLNEGGHALYEGGETLTALAALGIDPPGASPDIRRYRGLTADGTLGLYPMGPSGLVRTPLLGWRGRAQMGRMLAGLGRLDPTSVASRSVNQWVADVAPDRRAGAMLSAAARTTVYGGDLDGVSADAAVLQLQRAAGRGVRYVHGGWGTIVDALRGLVVAAGVEIRPSVPVRRIGQVGSGLDGGFTVEAGPDQVQAGAVVMACGSPRRAADLAGGLSGALERAADAAEPVTVASLDVGFGDGWTPGWVLGIGLPVFVTTQGPTADVAPEGQSLVGMFRYHDAATPDATADREMLEGVLTRLRPDWRTAAREVRFGARQVVAHGRPRAETGGLAGRPSPELADRPGLYVAGDWVGPDGLLADAAVTSGTAAGRLAARRAASVAATRPEPPAAEVAS